MKKYFTVLVLIIIVCTASSAMVYAFNGDKKLVDASGVLTSIEEDGSVIIDGSGYNVAHSAKIFGVRGERTTLDKFQLPAKVQIQFEHSKHGPVIKVIKEVAQ